MEELNQFGCVEGTAVVSKAEYKPILSSERGEKQTNNKKKTERGCCNLTHIIPVLSFLQCWMKKAVG